MPPVTIFMFIFAAAILLYAALLAITKDYDLLPIRARVSVKPKDSKKYAFQISKAVALAASAPAAAGIVAIWSELGAGLAFVIVLIISLCFAPKIMKGVE